ncbi:MAG: ABC transporter permease [Bacillota bacterium]
MASPTWNKVRRELLASRSRTLLAVLSIAAGIFAIGTILGARAILDRNLAEIFPRTNPASVVFYTSPFGPDLVDRVRSLPGVAGAEGRRRVRGKVRNAEGEWTNLELYAYSDFNAIRINRIRPVAGAWPPPDGEILLERSAIRLLGVTPGQRLTVGLEGGERELTVSGAVHDMHVFSALLTRRAYGYVTLRTAALLGESEGFNELVVTVSEGRQDREQIRRVADAIVRTIEASGHVVLKRAIPEPMKHPMDSLLQTFLLILLVLGGLAFLLSGTLVVNTIVALLGQQVRQIGIMKAVGASTAQVAGLYLRIAAAYGLGALLIAVPPAAFAARRLAAFAADIGNLEVTDFRIPAWVFGLQVATGLLLPVLVAAVPVMAWTRLPARAALSAGGLSVGEAMGGLVHWLGERLTWLSRPALMAVRNPFRRKGRLLLTLTALTLAGAILVAVFHLRASLVLTMDRIMGYMNYDLRVSLVRGEPAEKIARSLNRVEAIERFELWGQKDGFRVRPDGSLSPSDITVIGLPADTSLVRPWLVQGRWLLPGDEDAVVINTDVLAAEPDLDVGQVITLKLEGKTRVYRVVGIVSSQLEGPLIYMNRPAFLRAVGEEGTASTVAIVTREHTEEAQERAVQAVEAALRAEGIHPAQITTHAALRSAPDYLFGVLVAFLMLMAGILTVVGVLGLTGMLSLGVLERQREIAVMRAVGASNSAIFRMVLLESLTLGALSWVLGAAASLPLSLAMSQVVGDRFIRTPLVFSFAPEGLLVWLAVALAVSLASSLLPAWGALRLSLRDALAYE